MFFFLARFSSRNPVRDVITSCCVLSLLVVVMCYWNLSLDRQRKDMSMK